MSAANGFTGAIEARLEAVLAAPGVSPRAAAACRAMIERNRRPVRVGLFGLPGSRRLAVLNALAGDAVIPEDPDWPTLEVGFGAAPGVAITREDGSTAEHRGLPDRRLLAERPVYLRVSVPLDPLRGLSLLDVIGDAAAEELPAALDWGARRCDIALWCSHDWNAAEQAVWAAAPEPLKQHAILVVAGAVRPVRADPSHGFEAVVALPETAGAGARALSAALRRIIDAAVAEDVDAALMFLARHEPAAPPAAAAAAPTRAPEPAPRPEPAPVRANAPVERPAVRSLDMPAPAALPARSEPPVAAPAVAAPTPVAAETPTRQADVVALRQIQPARAGGDGSDAPVAPPAAVAALSRALHLLRQRAATILRRTAFGSLTEDNAGELLDEFETAMVALWDLAAFDREISETWPHLQMAIDDANELILLLKIEGGVEQVCEAATVFLQLRQEFECELAA